METEEYPLRRSRPGWPELFMGWAKDISERSTCQRYQVGCVITNEDYTRVLALGYNGNYKGGPNQCDDPSIKGGCGCGHAEAHAVVKLNYTEPFKRVYVTAAPCLNCAKLLINAGVNEVIFADHYTYSEGITLLQEVGIPVRWFDDWENPIVAVKPDDDEDEDDEEDEEAA